ncbi:MAG TPA: DUF1697 domain-containing protein [Caldimonas sp.]|jgi:uncharacterized protein (DUF1697 family)
MARFVALLRGINVGNANRVPMAELRALLSGLDYAQVATLLNSGNAAFSATSGSAGRHAQAIATALAGQLGVDVPVIVKSAGELGAIVAANPIAIEAPNHSRLLVAFAQDAKSLATLAAVAPLVAPPEQFVIGRGAAYLLCPAGIHESKAAVALLGKAGRSATTRNWATVLKLQALAMAHDG